MRSVFNDRITLKRKLHDVYIRIIRVLEFGIIFIVTKKNTVLTTPWNLSNKLQEQYPVTNLVCAIWIKNETKHFDLN